MSESLLAREARRRIDKACDLIRSAYRLESLDPKQTISSVRSAIIAGAEDQARDIGDDARSAA